ncbi:hypothetical protein, variant [Sphaeroforma arctica JP610]|uniref:TNFR-Cys domain-containing protein n=1 Tax=Sphaeroforma arctica JP610 TaxID=667725 RepID=A0A0L0GDY7_9EUKA|nr:hypothetical protein, variant [Sphaeroforma arctica JP610]KNC86478.1 hypothetical protein, variant [Sphaeroforma arctica JP610]|eukprot:XP_014160381.1 hypothetical protein, variant [Sphaeroforma arctica JP610]
MKLRSILFGAGLTALVNAQFPVFTTDAQAEIPTTTAVVFNPFDTVATDAVTDGVNPFVSNAVVTSLATGLDGVVITIVVDPLNPDATLLSSDLLPSELPGFEITRGCPAGEFYDEINDRCGSCARQHPGCDLCTADLCFQCNLLNYLDLTSNLCIPCTVYGPTCSFCSSTQCNTCGSFNYFNATEGLCATCEKPDNCPIENAICRNSTYSACKAGGCDRGFWNDPLKLSSDCQPCSDLNLGEDCSECWINPANSRGECLDCGIGNFFDISTNSSQQCVCQCATCPEAPGCNNGSQICGYTESQLGTTIFQRLESTCLAGQCQKFFLNELNTFNSTCNLTQVLLETDLLPNQFTLDELILFEDNLQRYFFPPGTAANTRATYPYDCYPVKIAPDPMRDNHLDIAITCGNVANLQAIVNNLTASIVSDPFAMPMCMIECFYSVQLPSQYRPYGFYERRLCFNCDPIANCEYPGYCDGDRRRSSCDQCEGSYYKQIEWPPYADRCLECTRAEGCSLENTRCVNDTVSFCLTGFCNDGFYQDNSVAQLTIGQAGVGRGIEQVGICIDCPDQPGCRPGNTKCNDLTAGATQTLLCATGECEKDLGYYNNETSCAGDYSACKLADMTYELCFPEEDYDDEFEYYFLQELADFGALVGVPGVQPYEYPWPFYVLGIRTNETSGNVLVDVNFTTDAAASSMITNTLAAALGDANVNGNIRAQTDQLAELGVQCVVRLLNANSTLLTGQSNYQGREIQSRPICLQCHTIDNCIVEPECPNCPIRSRCPTCQQGYYNNRSTSVFTPDTCEKCIDARNCTDGYTTCVSSNSPECLAGRCESGYWNNPGPPPLDCGFQDAYKCWSEKAIIELAQNSSQVSSDYSLWWIAEYGIDFVRPFYYCPFQGNCEVALWNVEEEKHAGYITVPSEQVAYWNYWLPGWSENITDFQYWRPTDRDQIKYYQDNYETLIRIYGNSFGQCMHTEPTWASPCKRWTECDAFTEFPLNAPTNIEDRICLNCRQANETMCGSPDRSVYAGCLDYYWDGTQCTHCSNAGADSCGCGLGAITDPDACGTQGSESSVSCFNWYFNTDLGTKPYLDYVDDGNSTVNNTEIIQDGFCCRCEPVVPCTRNPCE